MKKTFLFFSEEGEWRKDARTAPAMFSLRLETELKEIEKRSLAKRLEREAEIGRAHV